MTSFIKMQ